nr:MAG TPA: hypothetical protein [Caudoviricetes sp.]
MYYICDVEPAGPSCCETMPKLAGRFFYYSVYVRKI